jgi:hypothetical protein
MPPVIGELDVTVIAVEVGDAMSARLGVRLRYLPISPAAVPETLGHARGSGYRPLTFTNTSSKCHRHRG